MLTLTFPFGSSAGLKKSGLFGLFGFAGMPWSRRRGDGAGLEIEDGMQAIKDIVLAGEFTGVVQGQVGTWVGGSRGQHLKKHVLVKP